MKQQLAFDRPTEGQACGGGSEQRKFYDDIVNSPDEANRLELMAGLVADKASLEAIGSVFPGECVADFGAGSSTSLGTEITLGGGEYYPFDQTEGSVGDMQEAGFDNARVASTTDSGLEKRTMDVSHARFVFGWLDQNVRENTLREMLRVTKPGGKMIIIDYDWNAIEGPPALKQAAGAVMDVMRGVGFDPTYGEKISDGDLEDAIARVTPQDGGVVVSQDVVREVISGSLEEILPVFESTANSIISKLTELGMNDEVSKLERMMRELRIEVQRNSDMQVSLPDIVVQTFIIKESPNIDDIRINLGLDYRAQPDDFTTIVKWGDDRQIVVANPDSQGLIGALRAIQAHGYAEHGLVDERALVDGLLPPGNDPVERIANSRYFTVVDQDGLPLSSVRYVKPDPILGLSSLREFRSLPAEFQSRLLSEYTPDQIVAISAFSKRFGKGSLSDVVGSVIGLVHSAQQSGAKAGIMELDDSQWGLIQSLFGVDNFEKVGQPHTLSLEGINNDKKKKTFISLVCHADKFLEKVLKNANNKIYEAFEKGHKEPDIFLQIKSIVESLPRP